MSFNGDKSKPTSSFALLSQGMKEVQKSKKPSQVSTRNIRTENSPASLTRSNSSATIDLEEDMPPPIKSESHEAEEERDPNVPDRSFGDYFCPLCDSHMNSDAMWIAHISGKRHQKNVDKGSKDPKYDDLDVESCMKQDLKNVKDPVVGLSYIHEIRRKESTAPPIFTCFLCQATFPTVPLTVEHVLTFKHRMNFMKENSPDDYQLLEATNLKKGHMEPLVEEIALKLEQKYGRGAVKVKQEKAKAPPAYTYSAKRLLDDDDKDKHPRKNLKPNDKDNGKDAHFSKNKKPNVVEKDRYGRDMDSRRRHPSSEEEDSYKRRSSPSRRSANSSLPKRYESSHSRDSYRKDSFPRKTSPMRSFHPRSPPRREPVKDSYKTPYGPEPPYRTPYGPEPSYKTPYGPEPPPYESSSSCSHPPTEQKDDTQILKEFVQKIISLPPEIFFKIVLLKLDNLDTKNVDDLKLVSCVVQKAQDVLCKKLPPEIQAVINQRASQSSGDMPSVSPSSMHHQLAQASLPNRPSQSGDFSFIREFLNHQRSPSLGSSPVPSVVPPAGVGLPRHTAPSYSSQSYLSSSQAYRNPTAAVQNYSSSYQNNSFNNAASSSNASGSYQNNSYSSAASSSNSSNIPGLNLAEENRERPNYSYGISPNQSSHYPSYGY